MKRLLFLSLLCAVVPLFAQSGSFVYYTYNYYDNDDYDEYWYDDYWHDDYWVYMPYGHYCVQYVWWYPWWWDWYWARCHWCHHWSWDFFYAGFYVVWYDGGNWWYRPRYGHYVQYRLPHSYHTMRVRARTHGIYLPEKPPRELNVTYNENQVMQLARQQDPELFARVERENRSGNLEKMRQEHVEKVNREIAVKNREHGVENRNVDINELVKQRGSVTEVKNTNTHRIQEQSKATAPRVESRTITKGTPSKSTPSRIQKTSKSERDARKESPVRSYDRVEQTGRSERNPTEKRVERPREVEQDEKAIPQLKKEPQKRPDEKERRSTPQAEKQQERRPPQPQSNQYNRPDLRDNKR